MGSGASSGNGVAARRDFSPQRNAILAPVHRYRDSPTAAARGSGRQGAHSVAALEMGPWAVCGCDGCNRILVLAEEVEGFIAEFSEAAGSTKNKQAVAEIRPAPGALAFQRRREESSSRQLRFFAV